ncbi:hypothetical protein, partial [Streptomyces sp. NPDC018347]
MATLAFEGDLLQDAKIG